MNWTKLSVATTLAAVLITSPATAYADDPVPTVDQVVAIMANHAVADFTPASYSYRVDDPPPTDPPSDEAPAPPAPCICGGLPGARRNCRKQCERDGRAGP